MAADAVGGKLMGNTVVVRALIILGGVLAALALVVGHENRHLHDGPTFARHVDQVRTDDAVSAVLGQSISAQIIQANPDLVALRPLIDEVAIRVVGSDLLAGPTRLAAHATHQSLIEGDADSVALRIADAGAVATAIVAAVAPERAPAASDVSVTLLAIGDPSLASATVKTTQATRLLVWLLPLAALACFAAAIGLSRGRWRAMASVGRSLVVAAAAVGAMLVVGGFAVRRLDDEVMAGAVTRAAWDAVVRPMWWSVAIMAAVGVATVLACDPSGPSGMARHAARIKSALFRRPRRPVGVALRALVAVVIGIAAIIDPLGVIELAIVLGGVALVLFAISQISGLAAAARTESDVEKPTVEAIQPPATPRPAALAVLALAALVVIAGVVVLGRPGGDVTFAGPGDVCNGHAELCDRRFDEVAYAATHNSMSAVTEPGWYLAEQTDRIPAQLEEGVRALLIDVWSGYPAGDIVRTAPGSHDEALQIAEEKLGPDVVAAALRVADAVAGEADGPEARFLCHGLCETGSTPFIENLEQIRDWMVANPNEVVTLFIQDETDASSISADIEAAGLLPLVYEPVLGAPWPTLGEMITTGRRLVIMLEDGVGGPDAPWLVNGFEHTQETPFIFPTVESFNCEPNRGAADAPLFLLNHWLAGFSSLVSDAQLVNSRDILLARAEQCQAERGQIPNFIAVNFAGIADVYEVVDTLNGVG